MFRDEDIRHLVDSLDRRGLERVTFHWKRGSDSIPIEALYGYLLAFLERRTDDVP
jgi:hypothetical protein